MTLYYDHDPIALQCIIIKTSLIITSTLPLQVHV